MGTNTPLPGHETPQRAAIYLRVSTEEQVDGYGLDDQRFQCENYARAFGIPVIRVFVDEGISGTLTEKDRPGLASLLDAVEQNEIDTVIMAAMDRLGRKASLLLALYDRLEQTGCTIVLVKERIDTSTPVGRMMRTILAALAEFERDNILERTNGGRQARARKDGDRGGRIPYGYRRVAKVLEVDETRAAVVRTVFQLQRLGHRAVATYLNTEGIAPPRGKQWYPSSVQRILENEDRYRGSQRNESDRCWPVILGEVDPTRGATSNFRKEVQ
jgi:site-specific DNA recombinase